MDLSKEYLLEQLGGIDDAVAELHGIVDTVVIPADGESTFKETLRNVISLICSVAVKRRLIDSMNGAPTVNDGLIQCKAYLIALRNSMDPKEPSLKIPHTIAVDLLDGMLGLLLGEEQPE